MYLSICSVLRKIVTEEHKQERVIYTSIYKSEERNGNIIQKKKRNNNYALAINFKPSTDWIYSENFTLLL